MLQSDGCFSLRRNVGFHPGMQGKGMGREEVLQEAEKMMTAILHSRAFRLNL